MNSKILFMIIGNEVKYLADSNMDHREWYNSLGLDSNAFDNVIRGFIMEGKIVFFKGMNFNYDKEVLDAAKKYAPGMRLTLNNPNLTVCCGIVINSYGEKWEPIVTLKEEDLICINVSQVSPEEKTKPVEHIETGPVIEFKNDTTDDKFIKRTLILTIIILILSVVAKVLLIRGEKMYGSFDVLLTIAQVALLILTIYGYKKKMSSAKYFGIAASICLIFTFDILDIILGIIYFVFNVDQGYFINLFEKIKKVTNKK